VDNSWPAKKKYGRPYAQVFQDTPFTRSSASAPWWQAASLFSRGRRSGARNLTPLIGRDEGMAMLMRRWERARQGDGQLVLIVGEPGLGKSRLIEEFHGRLGDTLN
jgi:ATP-dependent Clp protease ATP-binding subunit ClpA